jgi:RNA polymerase sigma factor (sigma-70 family)
MKDSADFEQEIALQRLQKKAQRGADGTAEGMRLSKKWVRLNALRADSRRRKRERSYARCRGSAQMTTPDLVAVEQELGQSIQQSIRRLPPRERKAVRLHFLGGVSKKAAAARLGTSVPTFEKLLKAAIGRLRVMLESFRD